jgi:uncharacterized protein (DUF1810 family)
MRRCESLARQSADKWVTYDGEMTAPYDLNRFIEAQQGVYEDVVDELNRGRKTGHWIWYIFPQIAGLGASSMSQRYSISSIEEARAYSAHSVLGPRLAECTALVLEVKDRSAEQIFGPLDALKFRSCMTLFAAAAPDNKIFQNAIDCCFEGLPDPLTLQALNSA